MSSEPTTVFVSSEPFEAQAIFDLLTSESIDAVLLKQGDILNIRFGVGLMGLGNGKALHPYQIFTPPEQSEKALELIGGFLGNLAMLEELSEAELEAAALEPGPESESER